MRRSLALTLLICLLVLPSRSVFADTGHAGTFRDIGRQVVQRFAIVGPWSPASFTSSFSMTGFLANYTKNAVVLNWTTTLDNNKDHFEVERSTDGIHFRLAGTVMARDNSETPHLYMYTDEAGRKITTSKDLYYRLKVVDLNGNSVYSKVLVVRVYKTKALEMISVTPNPVFNDISLNIQLNENAYMVMKVADAAGSEILRKSARGNKGDNNVMLEGTSRLQQGIYFLEVIINSNERMTMKLIKD